MIITSMQNPKIKEAQKLKNRKDRDESHLFLIEGYRELKRAADAGIEIIRLFVSQEFFLGSNEESLIGQINCEVISCAPHVFEKFSYRDRPDGLIGVAKQMHLGFKAIKKPSLVVVAVGIEKPGNLGTILRSADAVGASGVIVCDRCTDIYNPNVVRASVGTLFTIPVVEATTEETLNYLHQNNVRIVAATPAASSEFTETSLKPPVAIVVGTEQLGLPQNWFDSADLKVKIPMRGVADSLNVATATTLLLYEVLRQCKSSS